ncbi:MAG: hypothetical protein KAS29_18445 [Bacteroidales bacterium]|nr:hypothetical protein [Bacteroidales bacterium]
MSEVYAQTPTHYPTGRDPMEFTPVNILVYIVFPLLLFTILILTRRRKKHKDNDKNTT